MRLALACLTLPLVGGCNAEPPRLDRLASRDVPCLRHQVFDLNDPFKEALAACGAAKPDLTGSGGLQQAALAAKVPFTIRPQADASLKQAQTEHMTGSMLSYSGADAYYVPQSGIYESLMPLSSGH